MKKMVSILCALTVLFSSVLLTPVSAETAEAAVNVKLRITAVPAMTGEDNPAWGNYTWTETTPYVFTLNGQNKALVSNSRSVLFDLQPGKTVMDDESYNLGTRKLATWPSCVNPSNGNFIAPSNVNTDAYWRYVYYGVFGVYQNGSNVYSVMHGENKNRTDAGYNYANTVKPAGTVYGNDEYSTDAAENWDNYFSFISMTRSSASTVASTGNLMEEEYGPVIWPSRPYLDSSDLKLDQGVRHPSYIIDNGYIYIYYTDNSAEWTEQVNCARAKLDANGKPGEFYKLYNGAFTEKALPEGFATNDRSFFYEAGGRASAVVDSDHAIRFYPQKLAGTDYYIGLLEETLVGGAHQLKMFISTDLIHWTNPTIVPGSVKPSWGEAMFNYPMINNSSFAASDTVDPQDFTIVGTRFVDLGGILNVRPMPYYVRASISFGEEDGWNVLEDYDEPGRTAESYAVDYTGNLSLVADGQGGKAMKLAFNDTWGTRSLKIGNIEKYPNSKWYKFDLKGPQTGLQSGGTFQFGPAINDALGTKTLAWNGEDGTPSNKAGVVFVRKKGETTWTKINDKNIRLPNNFDGEVMIPLSLYCLNNGTYSTTPLSLNGWVTDRTLFADLAATESVIMDNFCVSDRDMTPASYSVDIQNFNEDTTTAAVSNNPDRIEFVSPGTNRAVKLNGTNNQPNIKLTSMAREGSKYLDVYVEGPGGTAHDGWFQITPNFYYDDWYILPAGSDYYYKTNDSNIFIKATSSNGSIGLGNDFKGIIRYDLTQFKGAVYGAFMPVTASATEDCGYYSTPYGAGAEVTLDTYRYVTGAMERGKDYIVMGEDYNVWTEANPAGGRISASKTHAQAGDRITVTALPKPGYVLKGTPRLIYWDNEHNYPINQREGSDSYDDVLENNEDNTTRYFFTMKPGNVSVYAEFVRVTDITLDNAGASLLSVFGKSYKSDGLQFGARAASGFSINGTAYTLESCGTILMKAESAPAQLADGQTWKDWQALNPSVSDDVANTSLLDSCNGQVDFVTRITGISSDPEKAQEYVAVVYGVYRLSDGSRVTLYSSPSAAASLDSVQAIG